MANSVPFRRGDIVQRNSGGPRMMVEDIEDNAGTVIRCKWYEGGARQVDLFYVDALHHYGLIAAPFTATTAGD